MNIQKFTQKSIEALQNAQTLASTNQNAQVEQEHILLALLEQDNSLIKELLKKIGTSENFEDAVKTEISKKPQMTGGSRPNDSIYVSQDVDQVLNDAEKTATKMKDDYVSVEHIMLAIFDDANKNLKELFKTFNLSIILNEYKISLYSLVRSVVPTNSINDDLIVNSSAI